MEEIKIIYEDDNLLVLNKPSGLVVNISQTSPENTVQGWVSEKYSGLFEGDDEFSRRNGLVHRLDKETSGIILFAKDLESFENLQEQFKNRTVKKEYLALVFGEVGEQKIQINAPLGRNPKSRTKMAVLENGRPSVTMVERVKVLKDAEIKTTLIKAFPETGRTHQIRVHMAAYNHPILGDDLYAGRRRSMISRDKYGRLMLHAHKIAFKHPKTGEELMLESEVPSDFKYKI